MQVPEAKLYRAIGAAAEAIGKPAFLTTLLRLLHSLVPSDRQMAMRYPRHAVPDFLVGLQKLPKSVTELYASGYYRFDPFYRFWRERGRLGVYSYRDITSRRLATSEYFSVYMPKAQISDDLATFLPGIGGAAIVFFLERRTGRFTRHEVERLRRIYPTVLGLHTAHLARLLLALAGEAEGALLAEAPRAVRLDDRDGRVVFRSRAWREWAADNAAIANALEELSHTETPSSRAIDPFILEVEPLNADYPLAPNGRMYLLEKAEPGVLDYPEAVARFMPEELTPRERDIVRLILAGYPTEAIAKSLGIGKGTVKNHRRRLYDKLDITTERELFSLFLEFLAGARTGADL
ncbi:MAG: helix-turn-helix transcriptional regulator [Alphaproteobacteria bacterium]